jgi:hypothetical protein
LDKFSQAIATPTNYALKALPWLRKIIFLLTLIISFPMLHGCSYQYMDKEGNHRILGFGSVVVSTKNNNACPMETVSVTTIGVGVVNLPSHGGVTIGYVKNTSTQVPLFDAYKVAEKIVETESKGDNE